LEYLREKEHSRIKRIAEALVLDKGKVKRCIDYAVDESWVIKKSVRGNISEIYCRITPAGRNKLDNWTDEDDELVI